MQSCWADEVKEDKEFSHTAPWHFMRLPYSTVNINFQMLMLQDGLTNKDSSSSNTIVSELLRIKSSIDQDAIDEENVWNLPSLYSSL